MASVPRIQRRTIGLGHGQAAIGPELAIVPAFFNWSTTEASIEKAWNPTPAKTINLLNLDLGTCTYLVYDADTPPSTLTILPVLFPERPEDAKKRTALAMSSGKMLTLRVLRWR